MFELQSTWWQIPLRAVVIYSALLLLVRISGRRTVGQFTPFDLLVVMLVSESVSQGLTGGEDSVLAALVAATSLVAINMVVAILTSRSETAQRWVEGEPTLIARDGRLLSNVLRRTRIPASDVAQALREADCDLQDVKFAFLETDGKISILQKSSNRAQT